ncbi:MAG: mannose-1-phosphate guanylyltransferase/mannose-6-phosphate isomerase [Planktomarina sp.]
MIYPVILTGGAGTRLWPLSRKSYPKQFRQIGGEDTLLQSTVLRSTGADFADPVIVTGEDFRFIVGDQLQDIGRVSSLTLVEPEGRNTAPAILAATLAVVQKDPEALLLVLPSDHHIPERKAFQSMVASAKSTAQNGEMVTFGITPTRPETGYGYLELATDAVSSAPTPLSGFVEKPDLETAETLVSSGRYLWNAGIFLFRADVMLAAFEKHAPELLSPVRDALGNGADDLGFKRLDAEPWALADDISIDYAVFEKADNLAVQRFDGKWSDLGSWDAVWRDTEKTEDNVALVGGAQAIDSKDSLLYRDTDAPAVMGLGLENTVVVATKDAILVADKSRTQDVKIAVEHLTSVGEATATQTPRFHRPWGHYETLALGDRFQVKRIVVKPGGVLSLQSHVHRSEHWVVVEGTAQVTIDETVQLVSENQSVYIPLGAVHRMANPGKLPMVLIEVQTGAYLGEDDIVRYEDVYDRCG